VLRKRDQKEKETYLIPRIFNSSSRLKLLLFTNLGNKRQSKKNQKRREEKKRRQTNRYTYLGPSGGIAYLAGEILPKALESTLGLVANSG